MGYGTINLRIEELLREKNISKNKICKDLDIPRSNFNRYCRNECQRLDLALLCKLLHYLDVDVSDLLSYHREYQTDSPTKAITEHTDVAPENAEPLESHNVTKEISMYNEKYEKIRKILDRLYPLYNELEELYEELCSLEEEHEKYMDSTYGGYDGDEEGEDLAEKLNTATSDLSSAHLCLEAALESIDQCIPEAE